MPSPCCLHIGRVPLRQEVAAQAEAKVLRLGVQFAPSPLAREQRRLDTIRLDIKHVRFCRRRISCYRCCCYRVRVAVSVSVPLPSPHALPHVLSRELGTAASWHCDLKLCRPAAGPPDTSVFFRIFESFCLLHSLMQ